MRVEDIVKQDDTQLTQLYLHIVALCASSAQDHLMLSYKQLEWQTGMSVWTLRTRLKRLKELGAVSTSYNPSKRTTIVALNQQGQQAKTAKFTDRASATYRDSPQGPQGADQAHNTTMQNRAKTAKFTGRYSETYSDSPQGPQGAGQTHNTTMQNRAKTAKFTTSKTRVYSDSSQGRQVSLSSAVAKRVTFYCLIADVQAPRRFAGSHYVPAEMPDYISLVTDFDQQAAEAGDNEKKEETKSKPAAKKFSPPTKEEVQEYVREKGYTGVDPEEFVNFYAAKDWMIGKNRMKDWKAAVVTWNVRSKKAKPKRVETKEEEFRRRLRNNDWDYDAKY